MKLIKDENLGKLFDLYGNMLSPSQQSFMLDFVNNDLTISEIAENNNVSRQAVNDAIKKSAKKLEALEESIGALAKISALESELEEFKKKEK